MIMYQEEIAIHADVELLEKLLVQHRYIQAWEQGFEIFKELQVDAAKKCIVHWDIENNVDYIYTLRENIIGVKLTLAADLDPFDQNIPERLESSRAYISDIIPKIKRLAEELYFD